jgi:hypothetical protein
MHWDTTMPTRSMNASISTGGVFRFAGVGNGYGYGQILLSKTLQYVAVFQPVLGDDIDIERVLTYPALLAGWTMDGRFYSGDWSLIGIAPPRVDIKLPEYKVEFSGETWVTDVEGNLLRLASSREQARLLFRKTYSPIAFEKAFRAYHGELPWEARFDELRVQVSQD